MVMSIFIFFDIYVIEEHMVAEWTLCLLYIFNIFYFTYIVYTFIQTIIIWKAYEVWYVYEPYCLERVTTTTTSLEYGNNVIVICSPMHLSINRWFSARLRYLHC